MALTIPLVIVFGIALAVLLKFKAVGAGAAFIALMFGFYLATTDGADTVNGLVSAVIDALPSR